ncbi:TetR/AcrR family transcriptional regulator [Agarilytica rhodophyticola]|uniref:TetR/AcrR family transcriptional regulator n=1 Tax=Agarilytica rhodophyticola TaxID=1737490 RepID=UPI000B348C41|nr:TetR/AcrR family transcriptional regulator [Agarilytica rhodophyticola]
MSDKRSKLETVATATVQQSGFHNLSFRTLGDEVGVKSSSVHYYFPEKSDLACTIIDKYSITFNELLQEIDQRETKLQGKVDAFIEIFEDVLKANKFCLCGMMAAEVITLDSRSRDLLQKYFHQVEDWLSNIFEKHKDQLNTQISPKSLSKIIVSGLEGAILIDRVENGIDRLRAQQELIRSFIV